MEPESSGSPPPSADFTDEALGKIVDEEHSDLREKKIERLRFIVERTPKTDLLMDSYQHDCYREAMRNYVNGCDVSVVFAANASIEASLRGHFNMVGDLELGNDANYHRLIDRLAEDGWMTRELGEALHALRRLRNPYAHPKDPEHPSSHFSRMHETGIYSPWRLQRKDAETALQALFDYVNRRGQGIPFSGVL